MPIYGIETVVVGDVYSEATGDVIANANIVFQGTKVGTASNDEGAFVLRVNLSKPMNLVVSAVGFHSQRFTINPGMVAGIQVALKEKTNSLNEVYIRPGVNPALPLISQVRVHRKDNDRFLLEQPTSATSTTELYISDIQAKHLKRSLWKSLEAGIITTTDSSKIIPLYRAAQQVNITGDKLIPIGDKTEQTLVLSATDYSSLLAKNGNINFYQSNISILGTSFLSPLAAAGSTYYNYYLADSAQVDGTKTYTIHFRTKNPFYATFNGELIIDSATYALREISAAIPKETSVNYVQHLRIHQQLTANNTLQQEELSAIMDFAVKGDTTHIFPSLMLHAQLTNNQSQITNHQSQITNAQTQIDSAFQKLEDLPLIRFATWTATIINTGYIPTGSWLEIGKVQEILQVNQHETVHLGLPLRTNEKLMKNVSLEAGVGYGFRDQAFKGYGRINVAIPSPRRNVFYFEYQDRYVWSEVDDFTRLLHENSFGYGAMDFTAYAFEALYSNKHVINTATRKRQFELHFDNDWSDHIETQLYARVGWMGYGDPLVGYHNIPTFPYQSLGGILRVGFKERKIDGYFSRYHVYSHLPILYFGIEGCSYQLPTMNHYDLFAKFQLMIRQQADLGMGGSLEYALQLGCIVGNAPEPFLHHFEGNHGYAYDPFRFTLMNTYQYASTRWLALHTEWNGHGILFNLIPGIRYLRLRELVTFKLAYGNSPQPNTLHAPYVEIGCGIGNILRVMDIYSVWRLTNRDNQDTPLWAMRFRIHIGL